MSTAPRNPYQPGTAKHTERQREIDAEQRRQDFALLTGRAPDAAPQLDMNAVVAALPADNFVRVLGVAMMSAGAKYDAGNLHALVSLAGILRKLALEPAAPEPEPARVHGGP